jgi:acyltransferase
MAAKNRLNYIDYAKGIAIVLVVFGHILADDSPVKTWIYSFHMPLFFIVTGMLLAYKPKWSERRLVNNIRIKAVQLIYPYLTFSALAILWVVVYQLAFQTGSFRNVSRIIIDTLVLDGYRTLWFLPALFIAEILYMTLSRLKAKNVVLALLVMYCLATGYWVRVGLPISETVLDNVVFKAFNIFNRAMIGTLLIWLGALIFPMIESQAASLKKTSLAIISILVFAANILVSQTNHLVDLHYSVLNNPFLYYICAIAGSISLLLILKIVLVQNTVLEYFGKNSLIVMATHFTLPVIFVAQKIYGITHLSLGYTIDNVIILVLIMVFEVAIIELINRFTPWLIKI